jgi:hypothetical protein
MAANNSNTRTYMAPTCALILGHQDKQANSSRSNRPNSADFTLNLDDPDQGNSECITLQGHFQQLDRLQQITSQYIAELVAKFPLPTIHQHNPELTEPQSATSVSHLEPDDHDLFSAPESPESTGDPTAQPSLFSLQSVSKLLDHSSDDRRHNQTPDNSRQQPLEDPVTPATTPQTPYLIGGDSSLDHKLHLGDLATTGSGEVLTLSAIQLFDLATVLDEYLSDELNNRQQSGSKAPNLTQQPEIDRSNSLPPHAIAPKSSKQAEPDLTAASLARLPNLPKIPAELENDRGYHRTRRNRPGFKSAIPWVAAAAVVVGVPFLLFGKPNNPPKQLTDQTKTPASQSPNLKDEGTAVTSQQPNTPAVVPTPTAGLPTPWQAQPVQPPQNSPNPSIPNPQQPQNSSKIGIAPLPPSILGIPTPESQTPASRGIDNVSGKTRLPARESTPSLSPSNTSLIPQTPTPTTQPGKIPQRSINPGKISVSTQPLPILQDQPVTPTTRSIGKPNSMPRRGNSPAPSNPQAQPTTPNQENGTPTTNNNSRSNISISAPKDNVLTPLPKINPRALPPNPNLITSPSASPNISGAESPTPQVVPEQPLPSNADRVGPDAADNPSLQETKRYFQSKWKAEPNQSNSLQYVLEVNGKSGVVQNVDPQGEAATNYLKQTKMIKPGQKLVSPVAGGGNQKIRVLLQPDGNVDTLIEP